MPVEPLSVASLDYLRAFNLKCIQNSRIKELEGKLKAAKATPKRDKAEQPKATKAKADA